MKTHKNNQWRTSMQITTNRHKASTSLVFSFCNKKNKQTKKQWKCTTVSEIEGLGGSSGIISPCQKTDMEI